MDLTSRRLKKLRRENGYSQKQVADFLEIDQSYLSKIESGKRNLNDVNFEKLCLLYNCSYEYLLGKSDDYECPKLDFRTNEKVDLNAISKLNQIMGHLKVLREIDEEGKSLTKN